MRKLTMNMGKSKVIRIGENVEDNKININLNDSWIAEVESYGYLVLYSYQAMKK